MPDQYDPLRRRLEEAPQPLRVPMQRRRISFDVEPEMIQYPLNWKQKILRMGVERQRRSFYEAPRTPIRKVIEAYKYPAVVTAITVAFDLAQGLVNQCTEGDMVLEPHTMTEVLDMYDMLADLNPSDTSILEEIEQLHAQAQDNSWTMLDARGTAGPAGYGWCQGEIAATVHVALEALAGIGRGDRLELTAMSVDIMVAYLSRLYATMWGQPLPLPQSPQEIQSIREMPYEHPMSREFASRWYNEWLKKLAYIA